MKKPSKHQIAAISGAAALFLYFLPYFILGQSSYVQIWDLLDSEINFNILYAKYFFTFMGTAPEFMNIDIGAINTFSTTQIFFYILFPPFAAYLLNDILVRATAYLGMYLFMNLLFKNRYLFVNIATSLVFATLPFFTVYGLTGAGIPLLAWAAWNIFKKRNLVWAYIAVAYYAFSSTLLLSGFFIVPAAVLICIIFLSRKQTRKAQKHFYIATAMMTVIYLLCNLKLLILTFSGYTSYRFNREKTTFEFDVLLFIREIFSFGLFFEGHIHSGFWKSFLPAFCFSIFLIAWLIIGIFKIKKQEIPVDDETKRIFKVFNYLVASTAVICFISTILSTTLSRIVFRALGLPYSDFSRVFHALPFTWVATYGAVSILLIKLAELSSLKFRRGVTVAAISFVTVLSFCIFIDVNNKHIWDRYDNYNANIRALFGKQSTRGPTWEQFYAAEMFAEIDAYIAKPKQDYRVASIGIYPAVSLYNGFYTLDGHAQNSSLEHWENFRKIIAPELDKSKDLDEWYHYSNQHYIMSNDLGFYSLLNGKDTDITIKNLDLDIDAFKNMGGEYIFSAVEIENYADNNLEYCRTFTHDKAWWRVYLYRAL
jgi:hypothetical protein